ncbi:MAG: MlaD family protein [Bacteriovoracales bacterium]|nr:MlaD family protein [Bacteriovoracales bacterium]
MTEFKVGLLTLAAVGAVVIMSFKITSRQAGFGSYITYKTIVQDAAGIFEKSPIKVAGINAGRIKKIQLHEENALITFEILKEVKVTKGSTIRIKTVGLLGEKYIDILLNKKDDEILPEDSIIAAVETVGFESLSKNLGDILEDMKGIVRNIKYSLEPEKEGDELPLQVIVSSLQDITEGLVYELNENNEDSFLAGVKRIRPILENIEKITSDFKEIVSRIRQGRGTLGRLIIDEEVVDQVTETLSGVRRLVNKVDSIQTEIQVYTMANSKRDAITDLNINVYPSPGKFYRLGLTSSEFGPEDKKEVRSIVDGGPEQVTSTTERKSDEYRFNAMVGRSIKNWTFRFGFLESSGGIGIDYRFKPYDIGLNMDIFDYRESIGPQLRLSLNTRFWNIFYGKISGEDLLANEDKRSLSIGAGLRFTDEDLKGLVGLFL